MIRRPPRSTLFPYTRSSDLMPFGLAKLPADAIAAISDWIDKGAPFSQPDRKSTRLNSSHDQISYAVFCLKKKKNQRRLIQFSKYGDITNTAPLTSSH